MLKRVVLVSLAVTLFLGLDTVATPLAVQAAEVVKIGIVDVQLVITTSTKGQAARKKLLAKAERMRKDLALRKAEIEKSKLELERQASVLDPEIKYQKEKTLQRKIRDFEDQYRDFNEEMKRDEFQNTQPILAAINQVIVSIGKERGFTIILEKRRSGVLYAPDTLDLTEEVKKVFDSNK
ncbi:MAG: OmpH family outer membrane protein [Deltaproteobacteria bacterium]|nr:OmpH family outer membrane protein [Deltaproteobacteria bacterium]